MARQVAPGSSELGGLASPMDRDRTLRGLDPMAWSPWSEVDALKRPVIILCALAVWVVVAVIGSGCTDGAEEPRGETDMSEVVIEQSDQGNTFEVRPGDRILIRLEENPTTGYRWEVDLPEERVIAREGSDYVRAAEAGVGGGGTRTFYFGAQSPGAVDVVLTLRREWEAEEAAIDRFEVTIRVQRE